MRYNQQITENTYYTVRTYGDVYKYKSSYVIYGEAAKIEFGSQGSGISGINAEGIVSVPVNITNTGQVDEEIVVSYQLSDISGNSIAAESRTYYLPVGSNTTDTLYYELARGDYQISAASSQPSASTETSFKVVTFDDASISVTAGNANALPIPVTIALTNKGWNTIDGSIHLSVVDGEGTTLWRGETEVAGLKSQESGNYVVNVEPAAIDAGIHSLRAVLYNNAEQEVATTNGMITIAGPEFAVTALPIYQTFNAGEEGTFIFKVKNIGNKEGEMNFNLRVIDVLDHTQTEWLKPGEKKELSFAFILPDDLEEKDYFADYELRDDSGTVNEKGQVKFHLAGINIDVNASLDKDYYSTGDTAVLTLDVTNLNSELSGLNLFARINYAGHEEQKPFVLNGTETLTFNVPVKVITGEKLFYGIYHGEGRSIHLNTLYIYEAGEAITITTDKRVYEPGETIALSISGTEPGQMTLYGPGDYAETFSFSGNVVKSITLPTIMTAGTYYIDYELVTGSGKHTGNYKVDVKGIEVKILEAALDKGKYASADTIKADLKIYSNEDMPALVKISILDAGGNYTDSGSEVINLTSTEPLLVSFSSNLDTDQMGIHQFVYRVYTEDEGLILSSGAEFFDVGEAQLIGIAIDKKDYPTLSEPINLTINMYGSTTAEINIYVDDQLLSTETVVLEGFDNKTIGIDPAGEISPGTHILKAVVTAGGLVSSREAEFIMGSSLPDFVIHAFAMESDESSIKTLAATVTNQGKTESEATNVTFYDGDPERGAQVIGLVPVPAILPGESATVTYEWNLLGHAGEHSIYAVANGSFDVVEFNDDNNSASASVEVPEIILNVDTSSENYEANQTIGIVEDMANLTAYTVYSNVILETKLTDSFGDVVKTMSESIPSFGPGESTYTETWNTATNKAGRYMVDASLKIQSEQEPPPLPWYCYIWARWFPGWPPPAICEVQHVIEEEILAEASTSFEILPTVSAYGSMTLSANEVIQGFPLDISYSITNNGNVDITGATLVAGATNKTTDKKTTLASSDIDTLYLGERASGTLKVDSVNVEPGEYTIALDLLSGEKSIEIASKDLTVKPPLKVTKSISALPRALVWANAGSKGKSGNANTQQSANEIIARTALNSIGAYYKIVYSEPEFIEGMRSDYYNVFALIDTGGPTTDGLTSELVERVSGGDALILTSKSNVDEIKVKELTGTKFTGYMKNSVRTATTGLPIYEVPSSMTVTGKIQKVETISRDLEVAGVVTDKGKDYPAITINSHGDGRAALITFDMGEFSSTTGDTSTYAALLGRIINYTSPTVTDITSGTVLPIEIAVQSLGSAFDLKIVEDSGNLAVLDANNGGVIDGLTNTVTWNIRLDKNKILKLVYLSGLSDYRDINDTETEVYYLNNDEERLYNSYGLVIEQVEEVMDIHNRVLTLLNGLTVSKKETSIKDSIIRDYEKNMTLPSVTRKDIEKDIHELLKLTDNLKKLSPDTEAIRSGMDDMLKILERRWVVAR